MQKVVLGKVVGKDGVDGREIELRATSTHIQWHYAGDIEWIDILPLSAITGPQGIQGVEGKKLMLQATSEFVQFKYEGETTWTNLVALSELKGAQGPQGERGLQGNQGEPGSQIRYGAGVPETTIGVKGDTYVNTSSDLWDVYYKSSATQWDRMGQMKGEAGGLGGDTVPIGVMLSSTSNTPPDGWLLCDGSVVSRKDYTELFAVIGTSYGAGDGSTTFTLPNEPNPLTYTMVADNAFQTLSREPELYTIIKAKQLVPVVASVINDSDNTSETDAMSAKATKQALENALSKYKQYVLDSTTITKLSVPTSTFKIPTNTYTKLRFTKSEQIGQGTTKLVHLSNNVAYIQVKGVYRITVDQLWFDTLKSNTGSVQIRIGNDLKISVLVTSSSSLGAQIYSACGIAIVNNGSEIPVEIFQSTGADVTIKNIDVKIELLSRLEVS